MALVSGVVGEASGYWVDQLPGTWTQALGHAGAGAAATWATGGDAELGALNGLSGYMFNEMMHPKAVQDVRDNLAAQYAAQHPGMTEEDARGILLRAGLASEDSFSDRYLGHAGIDSAETRGEALQFLSDHNAITPNGALYPLYGADRDNASAGVYQLMKDPQSYADVMHAMNPANDPNAAKALNDYYNQMSFNEAYTNWANADAAHFLDFNGRLALMGASGGLSGGVPFLAAAYDGTKVGVALQFVAASRAGAAAIGATANTVAQLAKTGGDISQLNPVDIGASALGGALGLGGGLWWNVGVGAGVGTIQTAGNNWYQGKNDSLYTGRANGSYHYQQRLLGRG